MPHSIGGCRYFITFTDDHTRKLWVVFLRFKSEAYQAFRDWKAKVERQTGLVIKVLRTDNGGEFRSRLFEDYLRNLGVIHESTVPYTPEQNGLAEIFNRIIVERARCVMYEANLSIGFWAEVVHARSSTSSTALRTPDCPI